MNLFEIKTSGPSKHWVNLDSVVQVTYHAPARQTPVLVLSLQNGTATLNDPDNIEGVAKSLGILLPLAGSILALDQ